MVEEEISILRSWKRMSGGYDSTAKLVNAEIAKLGDTGTFADLAGIDKELGLPKGTSFEMSGFADYFECMSED